MGYEITIQDRAEVAIASVRKEIDQSQLGHWIEEACGQIFPALGAAGLHPTGPMVCRYHTWADDRTDCEIGFPISGDPPEALQASATPAGRNAVTIHVGRYEGLPNAYEAIGAWMDAEGLTPGVGPYEVYLDEADESRADELRTEVVWPLA